MKRKKLLFLIPIAVVAIAGFAMLKMGNKGPQALPVDFTSLKKSTIRSMISTDGTVQSTNSVNVYSELNYAIKDIPVKVGDHVNAGDTLCTLNPDTLLDNIQKSKMTISAAGERTQQQIKTNQKQYDYDKTILEKGLNTQITQAQDTVNTAKTTLTDAQKKLNDAKSHVDQNLNASLVSARSSYESASTTLSRAEKDLRERKSELGSDYAHAEKDYNEVLEKYEKAVKKDSDNQESLKQDVLDCKEEMDRYEKDADSLYGESPLAIKKLRQNVTDAQQAFSTAEKNLAVAQKAVDEELTSFQSAVDSAQRNYNSAIKAQKSVQSSVQQDLQKQQLALETSKIEANNAVDRADLKALQKQLGKCVVTAPVSGTVTAVYAVKGSPATGVMFIIEDTNGLELSVKIKEYDVNTIKEGMPAIIKSDSTGDDEYEGYLEKVSPAAIKSGAELATTTTKTQSSTNAEFEATILVSSKSTKLRIGMNAKANIILKQKDNVFAVPFEAVGTNEQGKNVVYIAKAQKDGTYIAEPVPVTMGIETDYEVEISGKGLGEGSQIISDAKPVVAGMAVMKMPSGNAAANAVGAVG